MSRKPRSDSLWAALKNDDSRSLVFEWLIVEGISYEECAARCAERFGFSPSTGSLTTFYKDHAFQWKIEQAKLQAEESKKTLPADYEAKIKQGLAQRTFEKAFSELSVKELYALRSLELEAEKLKLKTRHDTKKLEQAERRLVILESNAQKAKAALEQIKTKGGLTPETLKQIEEAAGLL